MKHSLLIFHRKAFIVDTSQAKHIVCVTTPACKWCLRFCYCSGTPQMKRMEVANMLWEAGVKAEFGFKPNPKMGDQLNYALEQVAAFKGVKAYPTGDLQDRLAGPCDNGLLSLCITGTWVGKLPEGRIIAGRLGFALIVSLVKLAI
eukprot:scaffold295169_cov18-Tisochrysis_lutea.AAC.3